MSAYATAGTELPSGALWTKWASLQTNIMELLPQCLPCKFCRDSCRDFLEDMHKEMGDVEVVIKSMKYIEWMYRLHEKVNAKLRKQKLADLPEDVRDAVEGLVLPAPPLETLCKRLTCQQPYFSAADVLCMLVPMLVNCYHEHSGFGTMSSPHQHTYLTKFRNVLKLAFTVGEALACTHSFYHLGHDLMDAFQQRTPATDMDPAFYISKCLEIHKRVAVTDEELDEYIRAQSCATARACAKGACI